MFMNKNITIREYREGDEASIMKLRGLVLSGSKDMDWWVWQYKQNPAGQAIIVVAEIEGKKENRYRIVGHQSAYPLRIKIENDVHLTVQAIDAMVHPDYRGLGIFNKVRRMTNEIQRRNNIKFGYHFPNEITASAGIRAGAQVVFKKTPLWIKLLHPENLTTKYIKNNRALVALASIASKGLVKLTDRQGNYQIRTQIKEIEEVDERFDDLWQKAFSLHKTMLVRDRAYLDWRYIKKPDANYTIFISEDEGQLLGYIVLRIIEDNGLRIGWIADILTNSRDTPAVMDLIAKGTRYFNNIDMDVVLCVMPPKGYIAPSLKKIGFFTIPRWRKMVYPICIRPYMEEYPKSQLLNPNNWYLTRGDSDLI